MNQCERFFRFASHPFTRQSTRSYSAQLFLLIGLLMGGIFAVSPLDAATVKTDSLTYDVGSQVGIEGRSFYAGETVRVVVSRSNGLPLPAGAPATWDVIASGIPVGGSSSDGLASRSLGDVGNFDLDDFLTQWNTVDGLIPGETLVVSANGQTSGIQASTSFLLANTKFHHLKNGTPANPSWATGAINANNSCYAESQNVPYRFFMLNLDAGTTHTFKITFEATKSSLHALDYLSQYNLSESGPIITVGGECSDTQADAPDDCVTPSAVATLRDPRLLTSYVSAPPADISGIVNPSFPIDGPGSLFAYNASNVQVGQYSFGGTSSNRELSLIVTFTVVANGSVGFFWGGHLATGDPAGWGIGQGSGSISGAPFHMSAGELDGSGGMPDLAIQNGVVCLSPDVTLTCSSGPYCTDGVFTCSVPTGATNYTWTVTGGTILTGQGTNSISYKITALAGQTVTVHIYACKVIGGCYNQNCCAENSVQFTASDCCQVAITCPPNVTRECNQSTNPGSTGTATFTTTGTCPLPITISYTDTETPGTCPQEKIISRLWKATDANGQLRAQCTQTITVQDNTAPVLTNCPGPVTVQCNNIPAPATPNATDNCDLSPTITMSETTTPGSCPQQYTITRTWTATDDCGNSSQCSQVITVVDTQPPVITCPQWISVECLADVPVPNSTLVTAVDNCDPNPTVVFVSDVSDGQTCPETITRTYQATDACGNSATCTQMILVDDTTPPVVTCPADITVECLNDVPAPNIALVSATDNCDASPVIAWLSDQVSGGSCPKIVTRTYKATDFCGNVGTCVQTITVDDTTPPVVTCPAGVTVECMADVPVPNVALVSATDNCDPAPVKAWLSDDVSSGSCPKTITRTYTATDYCGNVGTCTQIITVDDSTPPVIVCPPNTSITCGQSSDPSFTGYATATDNCTPTGSIVITYSDYQNGGGITRTWTATDECGNQASCQQFISTPPDTTPPQITCPDDFSVDCFADVPAPDPLLVTVFDPCDPTPVVVFVSDVQSGTSCPYTITRTYRATDASGNSATCVQTITIDDNVPPVLVGCPSNVAVECDAIPTPANVTATDNCAGVSVSFAEIITPGACAHEKTITRTWTATDFCGNQASCSQVITVQDDTAPIITSCPGAISVQCVADIPVPNTSLVSATDNCDPSPVISFLSDVSDGQSCPETITRTYKATDACGNFSYCTQIITVDDTIPPQITCPGGATFDCIGDVPQPNPALCTATDNCDPTPTVVWVSDTPQGSCPMTITRIYKATDDCGNEATCQQIIVVDDQTPPQLVGCPSNISVSCDNIPAPANVTATDNCPGVSVAFAEVTTAGSCEHAYTLTRTWTAIDACNNQAQCQQDITVYDNTPPQITCPEGVVVECFGDVPPADPALCVATDNCDPTPTVTFVNDVQNGTGCPLTITRTYKALDDCGNEAFCQQTITVYDQTPPVLVDCPQNVTVDCGGLPSVATVTATDNCDGIVSVVFGEVTTPGNCVYNYIVTRTWTATDACGNVASCQQVITVRDITPPQIACPDGVIVECIGNVPQPSPASCTATDNCDPNPTIVFVGDTQQGRCPLTVTRTYKATDACGNEATCTQIITVRDMTPPTFTTFPNDQNIFQCQPTQVCLPIAATDNCQGDVILTVTSGPGTIEGGQWCFTPTVASSFDVNIRATDTCDNYFEDTFHVNLTLNRPPTFTNCPQDGRIHWGQTYSVDLDASDPDAGQTLTFGLCPGAPQGATINSSTGLLQVPTTSADICDPDICVIVKDNCDPFAADTCTFNLCVYNDPPEFDLCGGDELICYGYPFADSVHASDPDHGPYLFYYLLSGPAGLTVNANTGVITWPTPSPGSYDICVLATDSAHVCDPCSPSNSDTCCFELRVVSLDLVIEKEHDQIQGQFTEITIDFMHQGSNWPIAGYDLLIQYDNSALAFQKAVPGKFFTDCAWEYFTYRFGPSGNCGVGACPSGILRIVAMAESMGGNIGVHPDCYTNNGVADPGPGSTTSTEMAILTFLVSNDRTLECQFVPIRFTWYDCGDNALSNISGDTLFISNFVYDYSGEVGDPPVVQWTDITGLDATFPTLTGAPSPDCDISDKFELVRCANFYNGGVDIVCADSIDAPGDINMNGIGYEIADAVMFTNYFITGLTAFGGHQEGSIAASDANRDGVTLSVSDLVYVIRVVVGDAQPYAKETPMAAVPVDYSFEDGVISVSGEVDMGGAALVVQGQVTPVLLADGMEMTYAFDGAVTRIVVTPPLQTTSLHSFRGVLLGGLSGEIVSLELATAEGAPVVAKNTPNHYWLSQNYPNPFNPSTKIGVALKAAGDYTLTIFNVQGQVVEVISGSAAGPERLEITWDATDLASGVYLYRLDAGQFTQTRKMLLLK